MFERAKAWAKRHPILTGVISIAATAAGVVIGYKLLSSSNGGDELEEVITTMSTRHAEADCLEPVIPEIDNVHLGCFDSGDDIPHAVNNDEPIIIEIDGVLKSFPRTDFIRNLHEGQRHSEAAAELAATVGIELEPGQTYVRPTIVKKRVA